MARQIKVKVGNTERNAIEQDFQIATEEWNEYTLLDGGRVRLKTSATKIFRLLDDSGRPSFDLQGEPEYLVRHNTLVVSKE